MQNAVLDLLKAARATIEQGWCQESPALDAEGEVVNPTDPTAIEWDIDGAFEKNAAEYTDYEVRKAEACVWFHAGWINEDYHFGTYEDVPELVDWNDTKGRTKEEVLEAFERAIREQERRNGLLEAKRNLEEMKREFS